MIDLQKLVAVLMLGDVHDKQGNKVTLRNVCARSDQLRRWTRGHKLKPGECIAFVNESITRARFVSYNYGIGFVTLPEYDVGGSSAILLRLLRDYVVGVAKPKDASVVKLAVETLEDREDRRKAAAKAKLRVA